MKSVLITGSGGFVGSHFHRRFLADGWSVTEMDVQSGPKGDCRKFFASNNGGAFDLVVHCAAVVGGRAKIDGNPLAIAANLAIDSDMARWAVRARPGRIVYFSSSAAYPIMSQMRGPWKLVEDQVEWTSLAGNGQPDQTYGWAKLTGEYLMRQVNADGIPVHVLRPFSGYGPGQSLDYPFPSFIDRARRRADPFEIWGDGSQVRDWVHISDVIDTTLAVIDADEREPVNIGTGIATDFRHLAGLVCDAVNHHPHFERLTDKPTGVAYRVADVTRMNQFHTARISLAEGIMEALAQ